MNIEYILPSLEVLIFNLITFNQCIRRKYTMKRTAGVLAVFTFVVFMPMMVAFLDGATGDGRFMLAGIIYIIPLKYLYAGTARIICLNMVMCWTYTMGIMAISVQAVRLLEFQDYVISLAAVELVLFLSTFFLFRKYIIPIYAYTVEGIGRLRKKLFSHLEISIYMNFLILVLMHKNFLSAGNNLVQLGLFIAYMVYSYSAYYFIYEVMKSSAEIRRLRRNIQVDALTGLGNRNRAAREINKLIKDNREFSVIFMDLDRFKEINDMYGHDMGDRYLRHFGKVFSRELGDRGKLYRYAGDEFVAVFYGTLNEEELSAMTECRDWNDGAPCGFNEVSAGLVVCRPPHNDISSELVLKDADHMMYRKKWMKKQMEQNSE